jgi:hypothetical protein
VSASIGRFSKPPSWPVLAFLLWSSYLIIRIDRPSASSTIELYDVENIDLIDLYAHCPDCGRFTPVTPYPMDEFMHIRVEHDEFCPVVNSRDDERSRRTEAGSNSSQRGSDSQ